ncbi:MAG: hypothetical protein JSW63_05565 [Ignavibacterium sp.]|nr:MAG: hypothetical protein JSW63_05565 [Ignavibacterium sp.]
MKKVTNLIEQGMKKAIKSKVVTYDFTIQIKGATEVKTSRFATEILNTIK